MNTIAQRLEDAMRRRGVDQTALASAIGVTPGTISLILLGKTRRSKYLPDIADTLGVDYDWLVGRTDKMEGRPAQSTSDPLEFVMMAVAMPPRRALTRMFEGLLRAMPPGAGLDEQAELLAERLPIGLAQMRDLLPEQPAFPARRELAEALATPDRAPR